MVNYLGKAVFLFRCLYCTYGKVDNDGDQGLDRGRILSSLDDPLDSGVTLIIVKVNFVVTRLGILELLGPAHLENEDLI